MNIYEIINHFGEERSGYEGSVSPPIFQSSIFSFESVDDMRQSLKRELETPFYTRGYNPTVATVRKKLAALEKAEDCILFASGSAAIAAAAMHCVAQGDHIISVAKPYSWTTTLISKLLANYGVESTFVDGTDVANFRAAIRPNTKLIYLESPNSLTFEMQDLNAVSELAKQHDVITICDNSYATPLNQHPIELGIDIVVHSASKFIGGHSDVVAGVLCSSKKIVAEILGDEFMTLGGIISPNDAWLLNRGLRTLPVRVEKVRDNSFKVLEMLEAHTKIERVLFPFSKSHPQVELAQKQMKPCGGLMTIYLKTNDVQKVEEFCNSLNLFLIACSWGGFESLQFPMCALGESRNYQHELPVNMIRLYIGLEDPELLIANLEQALEKV